MKQTAPTSNKLPYIKPQLRPLGRLSTLIRGAGGSNRDSFVGAPAGEE